MGRGHLRIALPRRQKSYRAVMQVYVLSWDDGMKEEIAKTICLLDKIP